MATPTRGPLFEAACDADDALRSSRATAAHPGIAQPRRRRDRAARELRLWERARRREPRAAVATILRLASRVYSAGDRRAIAENWSAFWTE